jgi:hypothetical protein
MPPAENLYAWFCGTMRSIRIDAKASAGHKTAFSGSDKPYSSKCPEESVFLAEGSGAFAHHNYKCSRLIGFSRLMAFHWNKGSNSGLP